jgi:hypothetical protein
MVIDNLQRIRAIERAMRDVIIPALDPGMSNAIEQAGYALLHLARLAEHNNWEYSFELAELRDFADLTTSLQRIAGSSAPADVVERTHSVLTDAAPLVAIRVPSLVVLKDCVQRLRQASDDLLKVALDGSDDVRNAAAAEVLRVAARREQRDGAWNSGAGYDTNRGVGMAEILES